MIDRELMNIGVFVVAFISHILVTGMIGSIAAIINEDDEDMLFGSAWLTSACAFAIMVVYTRR